VKGELGKEAKGRGIPINRKAMTISMVQRSCPEKSESESGARCTVDQGCHHPTINVVAIVIVVAAIWKAIFSHFVLGGVIIINCPTFAVKRD